MLDIPNRDRRQERREATRAEIVEVAWELCRAEGLAGLSLRDLAKRVGMQAPSLYSYFASKNDIYDAMFAEGARDLVSGAPDTEGAALRDGLLAHARYFVRFCTSDPVRYQLLFQRTIPGFEPSAESYASSIAGLQVLIDFLDNQGIGSMRVVDTFTALVSGIAAQQLSNEPGGDRWVRLVDDAVDMFVTFAESQRTPTKKERKS